MEQDFTVNRIILLVSLTREWLIKRQHLDFYISNNSFTPYTVSHVLGFGLMDAEAMVTQAKTWKLVAPQKICYIKTIYVYR
jgi:hypothetical protein